MSIKKEILSTSSISVQDSFSVRLIGLEPTRREAPDPKSGVSTNFTTGGGSGLPFSSELPNGWSVRFSACPMYDAGMNQIEFGIKPDTCVSLTQEDLARNKDTMIEAAREFLKR